MHIYTFLIVDMFVKLQFPTKFKLFGDGLTYCIYIHIHLYLAKWNFLFWWKKLLKTSNKKIKS